ncbi:MAG: alpha/beta hydrolase [Mobilicoccus sp.]|nr:alpha/beta hydrolase [Mobilicoccus sp.]
MSSRLPRGVPVLKGPAASLGRPALGVGLGLVAAGMTAAAGVAADRLSRDRRTAVALDATVEDTRYRETPDEEFRLVMSDGVEVHVEIDEPRAEPEGDPATVPTVVLTHGYCLNLTAWVFQRRALREAGYRVVLWDQRGHGRSGMGEADSLSIEQLGDDLLQVVEETAPTGPVVLVGHSMGGMAMMALGRDHEDFVRDRVVGAAFVATSPGDLSGVSYGFGRLGGRIIRGLMPLTGVLAARQDLIDLGVRQGRDLVDFVVDIGSFGSPVPLSIAQLTTDMIFGTRLEVMSKFFPIFELHDKRDALGAYDGVETLVISGTADRLTPPEHSAEIVRLVPGAEQVVVQDAGHVIMLEHAQVLDEHLLDLIARARRGAGPVAQHVAPTRVRNIASRRAAREARKDRREHRR